MDTVTPPNNDKAPLIHLPEVRSIWVASVAIGAVFWIIGLILWAQVGIDRAVLFYFNPMRIAMDPVVVVSRWLTSNGMAAITVVFVAYLIVSKRLESLDAPLTFYLYTICSFALSGIAGDLLKELLARPRPAATYGSEILALSQSVTPAIPSGHATKSIALILPFILLVSNSRMVHGGIKTLVGVLAIGVCFSRIILGAHYVSDVLAGIGMALIGFPLSMLFANRLLRRMKSEELPKRSYVWGFILILLTAVFMVL